MKALRALVAAWLVLAGVATSVSPESARAQAATPSPPMLVDVPVPDLDGDGAISLGEIDAALPRPDVLGDVLRIHDDGRVDLTLNVAMLDRARRRLKWLSPDLGFVDGSFPDGRVSWQGTGWAKPTGWSVIDLQSGGVRFSSKNVPWLDPHGDFEVLYPNGLITGSLGVARVDMETGQVRWIDKSIAPALERVADVTEGGMATDGNEVARVSLVDGSVMWKTKGLSRLIGNVHYLDDQGHVAGRWQTGVASGVALINTATGKLVFTSADISRAQRDALRDLGILDVGRLYGRGLVDHLIKARRNPGALKQRPIAVVLYPASDWNREFEINSLDAMTRHYDVLYYEVDGDAAFYRALDEIKALYLPIELAIIGGHASARVLNFGATDPRFDSSIDPSTTLDASDEAELAKRAGLFAGAAVVVDGCSTGEGGSKEPNLANLIARTLGAGAAAVYAPMGVSHTMLQFDADGRFVEPIFFTKHRSVQTYRVPR